MLVTMLPFTKYTVDESNALRKTIAKKQMKKVALEHDKYFARGKELGTSYDILDFAWRGISRQLGYSFSIK